MIDLLNILSVWYRKTGCNAYPVFILGPDEPSCPGPTDQAIRDLMRKVSRTEGNADEHFLIKGRLAQIDIAGEFM